jgi:hypothetical protein
MPVYKLGCSGGHAGTEFADRELPQRARLAEVRVRHGTYVDALQMVYETTGGSLRQFERHGGGGGEAGVLKLDAGEYLTAISGRVGDFVDSIEFETSKRRKAGFGGEGGWASYRYEAPPGTAIVGFWGRSSDVLNAVGVLLRPHTAS